METPQEQAANAYFDSYPTPLNEVNSNYFQQSVRNANEFDPIQKMHDTNFHVDVEGLHVDIPAGNHDITGHKWIYLSSSDIKAGDRFIDEITIGDKVFRQPLSEKRMGKFALLTYALDETQRNLFEKHLDAEVKIREKRGGRHSKYEEPYSIKVSRGHEKNPNDEIITEAQETPNAVIPAAVKIFYNTQSTLLININTNN